MRLSPSAAALFWYLRAHGGEAGYSTQQQLAEDVGIAYGTLKDGLKELRAKNLIYKNSRGLRLSSYTVSLTDHTQGEESYIRRSTDNAISQEIDDYVDSEKQEGDS